MKIHNVQQGSVEWMVLRAGIPTASEWGNLVTPKWAIRTGDMVQSYLCRKLAEAWLGGPLATFNTFEMDAGKLLEEEARPWFSLEYNVDVQQVGFITTDNGRIGCSPDGLVGEWAGIEIKCPREHTHVGYLLRGELPDEYAPQVYGSMLVTGRLWWYFLSYCRHFPPLVLKVERDMEKVQILGEALNAFLERFDAGLRELERRNGGPSAAQVRKRQQPKQEEYIDIIP